MLRALALAGGWGHSSVDSVHAQSSGGRPSAARSWRIVGAVSCE